MDKATVKRKFREIGKALSIFARRNYLMLGYIVAAVIIELTGIAVTSGNFYMTSPWLYFTFIALPCLVSMYIPGNRRRYALFIAALIFNILLDLLFIIIFDSTNGTVFDYAMFTLRMDAMMIMESLPISFTYVFVAAIVLSLYCTLGVMLKSKMLEPELKKSAMITTAALLLFCFGSDALLLYYGNCDNNANDLSYRLYGNETGTYSNRGIVGNLANELARGWWFSDIDMGDADELSEFIYRETTSPTVAFGAAKGYNVVTILCESFEWFTFLADEQRYPNGFAKHLTGDDAKTPEQLQAALREMYPNLYRIYDGASTVVWNNSYSLEKTDISENKSILGNYPLYEYINYTYPTNTLPYSLPNTLENLEGVLSNSFHDGQKTFYNRIEHHTNALGFQSYTASEDMNINADSHGIGERNLDSLMMEACKTQMFPSDRRFNTYITTITQHGQYAYRENLAPYYAKMDELGILPFDEDDEDANSLRYYCAAGMDFDKALGIMLDYLDDTEDADGVKLSDKTLITMFGDHNCYYQGVSNYVKNIKSYDVPNYTELYRVPVMMKLGNLDAAALLSGGGNGNAKADDGVSGGNDVSRAYFIEKFTCVVDIMPTILDVLGIIGFKNLMYGVSAFSDESSVLYSRAYDRFVTDKAYFNSINYITYKAPDADIKEIEEKCITLLDKISHVNRMFAGDFFKGERETEYYDRLKALQVAAG